MLELKLSVNISTIYQMMFYFAMTIKNILSVWAKLFVKYFYNGDTGRMTAEWRHRYIILLHLHNFIQLVSTPRTQKNILNFDVTLCQGHKIMRALVMDYFNIQQQLQHESLFQEYFWIFDLYPKILHMNIRNAELGSLVLRTDNYIQSQNFRGF